MNKRKRIRNTILYALLLLLSCIGILSAANTPALTPEIALRRMEKAQLIGPCQIIDRLQFGEDRYGHIWLGKSSHGYTVMEYDESFLDKAKVTYIPKKGHATLFCTYGYYPTESYRSFLPIFCFVDHITFPNARLTVTVDRSGTSHSFILNATKENADYLLFRLMADDLMSEDFWLIQQAVANQHTNYVIDGSVSILLELCDKQGLVQESYNIAP